ncbi:MAG: hypothetical protein M3440_09445 [Chloroflexota bacterium]|nr:hypothetical protein [Chloroflexota bacterium]
MALRTDQIVDALRPSVEALRPSDDIRRARRVDRRIDNRGDLIYRPAFDATWDGNDPLRLGTYHLWVDGSGRLRVKNGKATSDLDGVSVGGQV